MIIRFFEAPHLDLERLEIVKNKMRCTPVAHGFGAGFLIAMEKFFGLRCDPVAHLLTIQAPKTKPPIRTFDTASPFCYASPITEKEDFQMDITYTKHGDYYYPDLALPPQPTEGIGRFGRMRKKYLKVHQPDTFALMLMENTLTQHLIDIDHEANEQIELITSQLARAEGVTEDLKVRDQLEWIRQMNSCRARAEEQVVREIVLT